MNEQDRVEREAAAARLVQQKLEANNRHVGQVRRSAKQDLMEKCDLTEEQAKKVVLAINGKLIANITISYGG